MSQPLKVRTNQTIIVNGYVMIYKPEHPRANIYGFMYEHIVVLEQKLGRQLLPNEVSHHLNMNKVDNRPENLEALNKSTHIKIHSFLSKLVRAKIPIPLNLKDQLAMRKPGKKYDSLRKIRRNKALYQYFHTHPEMSLAEVGKIFNMSRQRVWEILKNEERNDHDKEGQ